METALSPTPCVTVAIATITDQVRAIRLPAVMPDVTYLILVQGGLPEVGVPQRSDVRVLEIEGRGLSVSRNAAIDRCETPYVLFSDDDVVLEPEGIAALAEALTDDPGLGIAVGWRADRRPLPGPHRLAWYNAGHVCAPEFMVRLTAIQTSGVRFDERFGVGATHPIGEDYIFITDLLSAGVRGRCFPKVIGAHPGGSTGDNWSDPEITLARKAMLTRCFGRWALPVRVVYAIKHRARLGGVRAVWAFIRS